MGTGDRQKDFQRGPAGRRTPAMLLLGGQLSSLAPVGMERAPRRFHCNPEIDRQVIGSGLGLLASPISRFLTRPNDGIAPHPRAGTTKPAPSFAISTRATTCSSFCQRFGRFAGKNWGNVRTGTGSPAGWGDRVTIPRALTDQPTRGRSPSPSLRQTFSAGPRAA